MGNQYYSNQADTARNVFLNLAYEGDLPSAFRSKLIEINLLIRKEEYDVEGDVYPGADHRQAAAH